MFYSSVLRRATRSEPFRLSTREGNRILILGARSPVALDLSRSLGRSGAEIHLADSLRFPLARATRSAERFHRLPSPRHAYSEFRIALLEIVRQNGITQVLPTCEESFYVSKMKNDFPSGTKVWVSDFSVMRKLHHKGEFNSWIREFGLSAPETKIVTSRTELMRSLQSLEKGKRWVLKPAYSRFAAHARIGTPSDLLERIESVDASVENPLLIQEYIGGKEFCTYALVDGGKPLAISTYDHAFRAGKGAGICFEPVLHSGIDRWIEKFAGLTGITGQISFDFIETPDGDIYPLECNPRATSGLHLLAGDSAFGSLFTNRTSDQFLRPEARSASMLGLAMWIYGVPSLRTLKEFRNWVRIMMHSRDCIFSWKDPVPFLTQFFMFAYFIALARRKGISELEASTEDIEWNGEIILS